MLVLVHAKKNQFVRGWWTVRRSAAFCAVVAAQRELGIVEILPQQIADEIGTVCAKKAHTGKMDIREKFWCCINFIIKPKS